MIGNKFLSVAGASEPTDAQFNYVTMLLHGDGTNGAQNNTFTDSSSNNFTITRNGNTTQGSFSPYGSNWSNYFASASSDYLSNGTGITVGSGNFTVEFWYFSGANGYPLCIGDDSVATGMVFRTFTSGNLSFGYVGSMNTFTAGAALNVWNHVAFVRNSGTVTCYLNGTSVGTVSNSANVSGAVTIGGELYSGTTYAAMTGYLSNIRVTTTAVYTGNFTPSTTPLTAISGTQLLACQSNRFKDSSSNALALTPSGTPSVQRFNPFGTSTAYSTATIGGSGYFDGTGDYLNFTEQTISGDFTLEGWFYPTLTSGTKQQCLFGGTSTNTQLCIDEYNYGGIGYYNNGVRFDLGRYSGAPFFSHNCWNHFAYVKSGTTVTLYINGVSQAGAGGSVTDSGSFKLSAVLGNVSYGLSFLGYANIRVSTTARYSSNFTPATSPWTSDASTLLLIQMTNGAIYDNAMMNDLETVGNAQISTSVKKYGTGSMAFDGSGDWLQVANTPNLRLGGDFTIEFWVYQNTLTGYQTAYSFGYVQASSILIQTSNGTGKWDVYIGGVLAASDTGPSVSTNTWYHIAVVRAGSTVTIYRNGSSVGSGTSATAIDQALYEGTIGTGGAFYLNGYMDDFRITKGYARYTTTFTPPTAALPDKGT